MTDNDIIKALEEEKKYVMGLQHRLECHGEETPGLIKNCVLLSNTLNLINRQKAEIEKLYIALEENQKATKVWKDIAHRETGYVKITRIETVKEFAERLKRDITINNTEDGCLIYSIDYGCLMEDIDNLVEEMTEEQE